MSCGLVAPLGDLVGGSTPGSVKGYIQGGPINILENYNGTKRPFGDRGRRKFVFSNGCCVRDPFLPRYRGR